MVWEVIRKAICFCLPFEKIASKVLKKYPKHFSNESVVRSAIDKIAVKLLIAEGHGSNKILRYIRNKSCDNTVTWTRAMIEGIRKEGKPHKYELRVRFNKSSKLVFTMPTEHSTKRSTKHTAVDPTPASTVLIPVSNEPDITSDIKEFRNTHDLWKKGIIFKKIMGKWFPFLPYSLKSKLTGVGTYEQQMQFINEEFCIFFAQKDLYLDMETWENNNVYTKREQKRSYKDIGSDSRVFSKATIAYISNCINWRITKDDMREWLTENHLVGGLDLHEMKIRQAKARFIKDNKKEPNLTNENDLEILSKLTKMPVETVIKTETMCRTNKYLSLDTPVDESGENNKTLHDVVPDEKANIESAFERNVLINDLEQAKNSLSEKKRKLLNAFFGIDAEKQTAKEIEQATGIKRYTIMKTIKKSIRELREKMKQHEYETA